MRNTPRTYGDVTLIDGTVVDSGSEAWRRECEARAILAMPTKAKRIAYLDGYRTVEGRQVTGILQRRGAEAHAELKELMMTIWRQRQGGL